MDKVKKAIRLSKQVNEAWFKREEVEEEYKKIDDECFKFLKTLNQKEFEEYIKIIDKDIN